MNDKEYRKMEREERAYEKERFTADLIERVEDVHCTYNAGKYTMTHPRAKTALTLRTKDFPDGWVNKVKVKAWVAKFKGPWPLGGRHEEGAFLEEIE